VAVAGGTDKPLVTCFVRRSRRPLVLFGLHDCRGCEQLRYRLDARDRVGGDRSAALAIPVAEALDPQRPIAIDERDGQTRYSLLGHELRDPLSVPGDDGRRHVSGRGWWRRPERNDRGGEPKQEAPWWLTTECCLMNAFTVMSPTNGARPVPRLRHVVGL
jgi:hypothetical protein